MERDFVEFITKGEQTYIRLYDEKKDVFSRIATVGRKVAEVSYDSNRFFVFEDGTDFYILQKNNESSEVFVVEPEYLLGDEKSCLIELKVKGYGFIFLHKGLQAEPPFFLKRQTYAKEDDRIYFQRGSRFQEYFYLSNNKVFYNPANY